MGRCWKLIHYVLLAAYSSQKHPLSSKVSTDRVLSELTRPRSRGTVSFNTTKARISNDLLSSGCAASLFWPVVHELQLKLHNAKDPTLYFYHIDTIQFVFGGIWKYVPFAFVHVWTCIWECSLLLLLRLTLFKIIISRGEDGKWCIGHWFVPIFLQKCDCKTFPLMYDLICHSLILV